MQSQAAGESALEPNWSKALWLAVPEIHGLAYLSSESSQDLPAPLMRSIRERSQASVTACGSTGAEDVGRLPSALHHLARLPELGEHSAATGRSSMNRVPSALYEQRELLRRLSALSVDGVSASSRRERATHTTSFRRLLESLDVEKARRDREEEVTHRVKSRFNEWMREQRAQKADAANPSWSSLHPPTLPPAAESSMGRFQQPLALLGKPNKGFHASDVDQYPYIGGVSSRFNAPSGRSSDGPSTDLTLFQRYRDEGAPYENITTDVTPYWDALTDVSGRGVLATTARVNALSYPNSDGSRSTFAAASRGVEGWRSNLPAASVSAEGTSGVRNAPQSYQAS